MTFTTSLNGISNAQTQMNVISNNLSNAETTGFKESTVNFADIVAGSAYTDPKLTEGIGSRVASIQQDFSNGSYNSTGSATDLAVNGSGFFTVVNADSGQTMYTRNGNFTTTTTGTGSSETINLVDSNGNQVQMSSGSGVTPITIPATDSSGATFSSVTIGTDGAITAAYTDGTTASIGTVALASFVSPTGLQQVGDQDWEATGDSGAATYGTAGSTGLGTLLSGSLEDSNVDMSSQLVDLITAQQYYQANSKAISTNSQMISDIMQAVQT